MDKTCRIVVEATQGGFER